jgi:hypothetical protein
MESRMLSLLLDENLSHVIAKQIVSKRSDIAITSVHHWNDGVYKGQPDEIVLAAANLESLTLVTCDVKSIMPKLAQWGRSGKDHAGVVFIDDRTITQHDFGAFIFSLVALWDECRFESWTNRVHFLHPPPANR